MFLGLALPELTWVVCVLCGTMWVASSWTESFSRILLGSSDNSRALVQKAWKRLRLPPLILEALGILESDLWAPQERRGLGWAGLCQL